MTGSNSVEDRKNLPAEEKKIMDWYPSLLLWCDVESPDVKLDGRCLQAIIDSPEAATAHDVLHFQWQNKWAVRQGDWKLISANQEGKGVARASLHHLAVAEPEVKDYAEEKPEIVEERLKLHEDWAKEVNAR